jgi:hypothetical protein
MVIIRRTTTAAVTCCGSTVGIVTAYMLDDKSRSFESPYRPDQLWGPPNLSSGYRGTKWQEREA